MLLAAAVHAGLTLFGAYLAWRALPLPVLVLVLAVTGLLAAVSLIDFEVRRVPDVVCLALLVCALAQAVWRRQPTLARAGLGLALGGGLFLLLALIRRGALGAGDVKLAAALGALLGYPLVLPGIAWGVIAGGAAALILLITRKAGRRDPIAYAPYLALGAWVVWIRSLLAGL
jgi:leader peptidase (prepilin peptidase)/N-methyltransferase